MTATMPIGRASRYDEIPGNGKDDDCDAFHPAYPEPANTMAVFTARIRCWVRAHSIPWPCFSCRSSDHPAEGFSQKELGTAIHLFTPKAAFPRGFVFVTTWLRSIFGFLASSVYFPTIRLATLTAAAASAHNRPRRPGRRILPNGALPPGSAPGVGPAYPPDDFLHFPCAGQQGGEPHQVRFFSR